MISGRSPALFYRRTIIEVGGKDADKLKRMALKAPLKRARLCLHHKHNDKVQEMIIAFCKDSYVRPHRHNKKSESFHIIEGRLLVVIFDKKGRVVRKIKMAPYGSGKTFCYRLSANLWHTVIPLTKFVIIHETTKGPFIKGESEFPGWCPDGKKDARQYGL